MLDAECHLAYTDRDGHKKGKEMTTKLQNIRDALKNNFRERNDVVDAMMVGLISKRNVFLLGAPGTAKSAVSDALCKAIGGRYFSHLMGKLTTADEIFGSVDIKALKDGRFERNTANMLPDAHLAFLDEVFKSSSAVLNSTLTLMNERTYNNGGRLVKSDLQLVIGASNEIPEAEELGALYDRFTIRVKVDYIQQDSAMEELLIAGGVGAQVIPKITLEELADEQEAAEKVVVPQDIIKTILELRQHCKAEGLEVSDRKWVQCMSIIKAYTHLNGRTEVTEEDLEVLVHCLWDRPDQIKAVKVLVTKVSNPIGEKVMKIMDAIQEVFQGLKEKTQQPMDAANKIKIAIKELEKLGGNDKDKLAKNKKLANAMDEARKVQAELLKEFLGDFPLK